MPTQWASVPSRGPRIALTSWPILSPCPRPQLVFGGVHPTSMPLEAAEHADAVVSRDTPKNRGLNRWPTLHAGRMQAFYQRSLHLEGCTFPGHVATCLMPLTVRHGEQHRSNARMPASLRLPWSLRLGVEPHAHRPLDDVIEELSNLSGSKGFVH